MNTTLLKDDPLWFKDAIIYEVPVKAFADSDGDGVGDFRGLTEKLDYIQDLGVTAIWLLPFFPSPQRDDGYDIADYMQVNPVYGTVEDFQELLDEAHDRGIRVIIELIVNHTSDRHPWFQQARKAPPGSVERDFYVWSDSPEKYPDVRIIFQDFETSNWTWDPVAKAYYWHRFYSHQPDLNYRNPAVQDAVFNVVDFWLGMGVDGLRLDAVPYLYEKEGTNCENLPETHIFLQKLRSHIDENFRNIMLLAEANQWPEDAAAYFGRGNECHMNFHFPLMPRLFMSLRMEDNFPIADILKQTPAIPSNCQWALFLRNHDELTLEMVSDEDRDYMYRSYAQDPQARINLGIRRRLAPLLGNDRRQIELMNVLLMSMPGTPVLYYGDEIGMGDNIYLGDRDGVRTPMQWTADRNAGFSRTPPQRLYLPVILDSEYHYEAVNVEAQRANPTSLWWWTKRLLATRARYQAFGRGTFELLYPENRKVIAFTRTYSGEHILVVANLSRFVQTVELDLAAFQNMIPVEIFGRTRFPAITGAPYFLSVGPYSFYWFILQPVDSLYVTTPTPISTKDLPTLTVNSKWQAIFTQKGTRATLERVLGDYVQTCPWFQGTNRVVQTSTILDVIPIHYHQKEAQIVILQIDYTEGFPDTYVLHLSFSLDSHEQGILKIVCKEGEGVLYPSLQDPDYLGLPLDAIAKKRRYKGSHGQIIGTSTKLFKTITQEATPLDPHLYRGLQDNSSIIYGSHLILKLYRRVEEGINPDFEVGRFLATKQQKDHFAPIGGAIEYQRSNNGTITLGVLQGYIPDTRDAWSYTLDHLRGYFEQVMVQQPEINDVMFAPNDLGTAQTLELPDFVYEIIGTYLGSVQLLGQRTAELHITLASDPENPDFAPEPFTSFYQRSIYQYSRNLTGQVFLDLKKRLNDFPEPLQQLAQTVLNRQEQILGRFRLVLNQKITALRTRSHGAYHLGQVLFTGKDFTIIDFKGEKNRPLSERRMKRSPLRDVAGMLLSFNYAVNIALRREVESGMIRPDNLPMMEQWAQFWQSWVNITFLNAYLTGEDDSSLTFLPKTEQELQVLLDAYLLEKAIQELSRELDRRQDWVEITLQRILQLLEA
ncbi:maltose alpha-D-glucosyltransferase [Spirulina subsalsa FACHB-351]|uniref:maltose alpha-D-glucosyltransferase n=1 Tax=Spirulina subsalsa FACHB-351 TaxID=234711 RepID=A0ABT3KZY2_9CYAN|nr:maltose alpha-D-glucosyltransferase [Spirulina subsalsa]MCW6034818.1 maltose alpha-D-glucosyltransferase [Spirulina subsalsa FACHB-351]